MIALVSADYFERLWCVFELAAFTRRCGAARLDLVPLHCGTVILSWCGCMFFMQFTLLALALAAPGFLAAGSSSVFSLASLSVCVFVVPNFLMIRSQLEARNIKRALHKLRVGFTVKSDPRSDVLRGQRLTTPP